MHVNDINFRPLVKSALQKMSYFWYMYSKYIPRKTIEGYLGSGSSLTFNTIKTKLIMHAFHSSRYLQSN